MTATVVYTTEAGDLHGSLYINIDAIVTNAYYTADDGDITCVYTADNGAVHF